MLRSEVSRVFAVHSLARAASADVDPSRLSYAAALHLLLNPLQKLLHPPELRSSGKGLTPSAAAVSAGCVPIHR